MSLRYKIIPVTPFAQNCSLVWCEETRLAAVVDPGGELEKIRHVIEQEQLQLDKILITHAHLDHAGGTAELASSSGAPIIGPHPEDQFWIDLLPEQCAQFGFDGDSFMPDQWLHDGDVVNLGKLQFDVVFCPGHTPGHVVFIDQNNKLAMVGDVIFQGSIGRTDFPRGNHQQLLDSIREKLFPFGDDIQFIPGHGPMSTFGAERISNPYVADQLFTE